jgi:hypothetical protein
VWIPLLRLKLWGLLGGIAQPQPHAQCKANTRPVELFLLPHSLNKGHSFAHHSTSWKGEIIYPAFYILILSMFLQEIGTGGATPALNSIFLVLVQYPSLEEGVMSSSIP